MAAPRPKTIAQYIAAAPAAGRPHLKRLHEILEEVAPKAEQTIKWNQPFFIEPRYLFAFSAHKAHLNFAPGEQTLAAHAKELENYKTTKNFLQIPYTDPLPEKLIRKLAKYQLKQVSQREDDSFW